MLSDRITLAVAHYYMSGTEANYRFDYGKIDEIKLSYTSNFKSSATLLQFNDLFSLAEFIEKSTKPTKNQAQEEAECTNMGLYELKSFRIGSIFVNQNANGIFVSSSENIANIDLSGLPHIRLFVDHFIDFFQLIEAKAFGNIDINNSSTKIFLGTVLMK